MNSQRQRLLNFVTSKGFHIFVLCLILLNAIVIGCQTSKELMADYGRSLDYAEYLILVVFVFEIICKILAKGKGYFKRGWDIFDFTVIMISLLPHAADLSIFRSFRILHSFEVFQVSPHMLQIIRALRHIGPNLLNLFLLMFVSFYILAVIGVELYGQAFPKYFGTLPWSLYTLFKLMVYDEFGKITYQVLQVYPYSWIYFLTVIIILAFVLINLFIAIVVTAIQRSLDVDTDPIEEKVTQEMAMIKNLQTEIKELKELVKNLKG